MTPAKQVAKETCSQKTWRWFKRDLLLILTIIGVAMGLILGFTTRNSGISDYGVYIIEFPGKIMLQILKMLILPLIVFSIISGVSSLDGGATGKMGIRAIVYYLGTTVLASVLGMGLSYLIHPGRTDVELYSDDNAKELEGTTLDAFLDLVRNLFPANIIQATFQQAKTKFVYEYVVEEGTGALIKGEIISRGIEYNYGMNVLGLIMFSICFGIVVTKMDERKKILVDLIGVLNSIFMKLVLFFMWYSPVGIMFLIWANVLKIDDMATMAKLLGMYMVTVIVGIFIHALITLPVIYVIFTRKNPYKLIMNMTSALATAFGIASSSATLPVTFKCLEENAKIDPRVTRFMLPIGATVNMDGTALYEAVAAIFIAQMIGFELGVVKVITICITAIAASVGAASIPSAGLVTMLLVFTAVGLPTEHIASLYTIDWFLDRFRTACNVLGDSFGAAIICHLSRKDLQRLDFLAGDQTYGVCDTIEEDNIDGASVELTVVRDDGDTTIF